MVAGKCMPPFIETSLLKFGNFVKQYSHSLYHIFTFKLGKFPNFKALFQQCQWIFANWSLSNLEKTVNESICCKFIISVHNYVYVWFVMLTTFRENFREGWTVRWSKRGTIFCYFSLTRTFLFILIFFGFLNCIYQAFTTDFYLLSFSLTTLYQLLKLHLVVRCQSHGLMNLWL